MNAAEEAARARKASALLDVALARFGSASVAHVGLSQHADDLVWAALEQLAQVRPSSPTTRAQVIDRLGELAQLEGVDR